MFDMIDDRSLLINNAELILNCLENFDWCTNQNSWNPNVYQSRLFVTLVHLIDVVLTLSSWIPTFLNDDTASSHQTSKNNIVNTKINRNSLMIW